MLYLPWYGDIFLPRIWATLPSSLSRRWSISSKLGAYCDYTTKQESHLTRKSASFCRKTDYLVLAIRPGDLELEERKTDAPVKLVSITTQTELYSFLGLCNVFRRFVPNISRLTALRNKTLRNIQRMNDGLLDKKESAAAELLKQRGIISEVLVLPNTRGR